MTAEFNVAAGLFNVVHSRRSLIHRFQLPTGRLEIAKEIPLSAGGMGAMNVRVTPDGKSYVHSYIRDIADLYLVEEH